MIRIRTVREFLWQIAEQFGNASAYSYEEDGKIVHKSYIDLNDDVTKMARDMHRLYGEQRKIAIIGDTSYLYMCAFFSTVVSANIIVPMDVKASKEELIGRLNFADVSVVILSDKYSTFKEDIISSCRKVDRVVSLESFIDNIPDIAEKEVLSVVYPDQVSAMLFTSGTTGNGYKAAMLTQDGMLACVKGFAPLYNPGDNVLSILPIHHCFEIYDGQFKALYSGCNIYINDSITNLMSNLVKYNIDSIVAVPAVANLLCSIIEHHKGKSVEEIRKYIGPISRITIGGAPVNKRMITTLDSVGILVHDGYGLTETCGGILYNAIPKDNPASCGKPFAYNLEMKIADSGELCVKGAAIMQGYYKQPELTNNVLVDGWFHTGDIATIDENNYVTIAGRKDNMIKLSSGEKIYPEQWEDKIEKIIGVTNVMVCAVNDHLAAVIYSKDNSDQNTIIQKINELNTDVPGFMKISDIRFRTTPFPMTSSMKVKRSIAYEELLNATNNDTVCIPPQNNIQAGILMQVKNLLPQIEEISITDNLYNLGLDSLSTLELSINLNCSPNLIYDCKTIEVLSKHLESSNQNIDEVNKQLKLPNINSYITDDNHVILDEGKTVLITGATGFLGPHIIKELQNYNVNIICLVRSLERFNKACEYYGVDSTNISTVVGDITTHYFGLSDDDYIHLCKKVDAVFHVAATVNHVGSVDDSYKINVKGTSRVIKFCKAADAHLYHMSSFAVSGFNTDVALTEDVLDINQQITQNPYIQTKYQAEEKVLKARADGVKTTIFRIGNLTKRASDGLFQMNSETSGLSAQIRAFEKLKCYPESMRNVLYDDTAVDKAAKAIVLLALNKGSNYVWHIINPNVHNIYDLVNVTQIDDKSFEEKLANNADTDTNILSIYYRMTKDGFNSKFDPTKTISVLDTLNFHW